MKKYKWNNLFHSLDCRCWCMGFDFARGGKPTGEKEIIHLHHHSLAGQEILDFNCDVEFEVIKFTNETIKDYELVNEFRKKPFVFYLARANMDNMEIKDPRGFKLYGLLVAEDEISMREFCKQYNMEYSAENRCTYSIIER